MDTSLYHRTIRLKNTTTSTSTNNTTNDQHNKANILYKQYFDKNDISFTHIITNKPVRCYTISDLHADTETNQIWIKNHCQRTIHDIDYFTILLIPGDIGSEMIQVSKAFSHFVKNYDVVCYIPGNHELWRRGSTKDPSKECADSISKFN